MSTPAYQVPSLTPQQLAQRMASNYPNGWANNTAISPGGVAFTIMQSLAQDINFELDTSLLYAFDGINILTAQGNALDLASLDFFGTGLYSLPRNPGQSDASFSAAIEAALFPSGATRAAVTGALTKIIPGGFRIIEPWSPADTGVIDGGAGAGMMFLDVDNSETPGMITDPSLGYQGFIQANLPFVQPLGDNPMPCMDNAVGTIFGGCIYLDVAASSMFDFYDPVPLGEGVVLSAINRTKCEGTIVWVQFSSQVFSQYFTDDGGVLVLNSLYSYPTTPGSAGSVWSNSFIVCVVPGVTPNPYAPPLFYGAVTPSLLLSIGGGDLPHTKPTTGSGQLWNNGGVVCIA